MESGRGCPNDYGQPRGPGRDERGNAAGARLPRAARRGAARLHPAVLSPGPHADRGGREAEAAGRHREDMDPPRPRPGQERSEEHTSELQSLMRIAYAVFCLKTKTTDAY